MSETPLQAVCPNCRASYSPPASVCWLCKKSLPEETTGDVATIDPSQGLSFTFSIASILLVTTLSAVFFGVLMIAPGLAILLAILCVPAMVRTGMVVQRRGQLGKPVPIERKVLWFLGSLMVTTIVATVVIVASVGTFCAVCLSAGTEQAVPVALLVAGAVTLGVLTICIRWIRRRWRSDVNS